MARVFSGIQPSGELHIGNYLGAVRNWVALQDAHECVFCIVDYHAITQAYEPELLEARTFDMAVSLLAAGLDPTRCILFEQSHVPEHIASTPVVIAIANSGELIRHGQELFNLRTDDIHDFFRTMEIQSSEAAVENLLLAATALGLATGWPGILFLIKDDVLALLEEPGGEFMAVVPVGYPSGPTPAPRKRALATVAKRLD